MSHHKTYKAHDTEHYIIYPTSALPLAIWVIMLSLCFVTGVPGSLGKAWVRLWWVEVTNLKTRDRLSWTTLLYCNKNKNNRVFCCYGATRFAKQVYSESVYGMWVLRREGMEALINVFARIMQQYPWECNNYWFAGCSRRHLIPQSEAWQDVS